jgi:restriction endonuclease Mrr
VKQRINLEGQSLADRNQDIIAKFLDIAERKVSLLDDYGDENWTALHDEIDVCLRKIAEREGLTAKWNRWLKGKKKGRSPFPPPAEYEWIRERLEQMFYRFHKLSASIVRDESIVHDLSGEEFETHIAKLLRSYGFEVLGTPRTGDQGADLIAMKNGNKIVIQAKRYQGSVGNGAVQEVIGAVKFYGTHEGWVVTNSTFTPSAKALAQRSNIKLVDGHTLQNLREFLKSY